ncbi:MAG: hypothetical protein ABIJ26_04820 [Candidatus Margulisiibacteriota bacterium]
MNARSSFIAALILFCSVTPVCANAPIPHWRDGGVLVDGTPGNAIQQNAVAASDGAGGYIVVYEDQRSGHTDICAQRIGVAGNKLWGRDGINVCSAAGDQLFPAVAAVPGVGAIIVWQDGRSGVFGIYAQKIDIEGNALWGKNGIKVCGVDSSQLSPQLVFDGLDGAIVAWQDYRNGDEDIFAQRIDGGGTYKWVRDGVAVCAENGTQWYPKIINAHDRGVVIVWADRRGGDFDIYAQLISPDGAASWQTSGLPVVDQRGNQENFSIAGGDDGGVQIAWLDTRFDRPGVYFQRMSPAGQKQFRPGGLLLAGSAAITDTPFVAEQSGGGACIVWSDPMAGDLDIYGQYVDAAGQPRWGQSGKALVLATGAQSDPFVSGKGPWLLTWKERSGAKTVLQVAELGLDGGFSWGPLSLARAVDPGGVDLAEIDRGAVMVWHDKRAGNLDVLSQGITLDGHLLFPAELIVANASGSVKKENIKIVEGGGSTLILAFEDHRSGVPRVYLQKLNAAGLSLWGKNGIQATQGRAPQKNFDAAPDGKGGVFLAWEEVVGNKTTVIRGQRLSAKGKGLWGKDGLIIAPGTNSFRQSDPRIVTTGNGLVVVFSDSGRRITEEDIFAQKVDFAGNLLWGRAGRAVSAAEGAQRRPCLTEDLVVVWEDCRNGENSSDIYAQKIGPQGNMLWTEDGTPVCQAPDIQKDPSALKCGDGTLVAWVDRAGGSFDIFAQRLDRSGKSLWIKDGVGVCQSARMQQNPQLALSADGASIVVWEDFRQGNWDLRGQKLSGSGKMLWGEEGSWISLNPGTQYSPRVKEVSEGTLVAWEDFRSGERYHSYLQLLSPGGNSVWQEGGLISRGCNGGGRNPSLAARFDNNEYFILAWRDFRSGSSAIYAQRYSINP